GNPAWAAYRSDLGRSGLRRPLLHASHWHASHHVLHAVHWIPSSDHFHALAWRLGTPGRWLGMATLGLGVSRRSSQRLRHAFPLSCFRNRKDGRRCSAFRELSRPHVNPLLARW